MPDMSNMLTSCDHIWMLVNIGLSLGGGGGSDDGMNLTQLGLTWHNRGGMH